MPNDIAQNNDIKPTAYILTDKGVLTLKADGMLPEDFSSLSKQLSLIMAASQTDKSTANDALLPLENTKPDDKFTFVSSMPVKSETIEKPGVASTEVSNLFDDDEILEPESNDSDKNSLQMTLADFGLVLDKNITTPDNVNDDTKSESSISTENKITTSEKDINNSEDSDETDDLEDYIYNTGYINNTNLWRRWIMAQMLRHYNKADGTSGFDEYFVTGTPYFYQWKTALSELKTLRHLRNDALAERERFFNAQVIKEMAIDYEKKLNLYISKAKKHHDKLYKNASEQDRKRCVYITIPGYKKKIYMNDPLIPNPNKIITRTDLMIKIDANIRHIVDCPNTHYHKMYQYVESFMKNCPLVRTFAKSSAWKNAFKGAGAFYTMDNMIKFHDCKFLIDDDGSNVHQLSMNESLNYLNAKTKEYKNEYYRLYALMRKFVADNNFTYADIPVDNFNLPKYDD